jgi:hypothetical protein
MLVIGGYFITYEQLTRIGRRRGLVIQDGQTYILNNDLRRKGITSIYAWPASYPSTKRPVVLICTYRRDDHLERLADCEPFVENEDDLRDKTWLQINEITDAPFVAIPDPLHQYNENGRDYD